MKKRFLPGLAILLALTGGVIFWRSHRAEHPAHAAVTEFFRRETPVGGWVLNQVQGRNVPAGGRQEKSMIGRLKSKLPKADSDLDWDKYVYGKGGSVIVATVYHQRDRLERVDLLGPDATAETSSFKTRIEAAFPGLPCRVVGSK